MRQIPYASSAASLRFDFPSEWNPADVSALTLTCKDDDGVTLLAAQAATLYTATELFEDADKFTSSIKLATGAGALSPGDRLVIDGIEGTESVVVKAYDSTTRTAELEEILLYNHLDGDNVYATWGTYSLDVSDTDDFPKGLTFTLIWTPTGSGQVTREVAQIAAAVVDLTELQTMFKAMYPRAWDTFRSPVGKFDTIRKAAERQVKNELLANNNSIDYDRVVDQDAVIDVVMAKMALIWALNGDENKEDEREALGLDYSAKFQILLNSVIWSDDDQGDDRDVEEISDHEHIFNTGW